MTPSDKQTKITGVVLDLLQQAQDHYSRAMAPAGPPPPSAMSEEAKAILAEESADAIAGLVKYGDKLSGKAAEILQGLAQ